MTRRWIFIGIVGIVMLGILLTKNTRTLDIKGGTQAIPTPFVPVPVYLNSDKVWELIQNWRVSQGLKEYRKDSRLCTIANDRSNDMFIIDSVDNHEGLYKKYSSYPFVISENAVGGLYEQEALDKWLASPPHLAALKKGWVYSCIGCKGIYCSQIFSNFEK